MTRTKGGVDLIKIMIPVCGLANISRSHVWHVRSESVCIQLANVDIEDKKCAYDVPRGCYMLQLHGL